MQASLTKKQIELLRLLVKGYDQETAASMLGVSRGSVVQRLVYARSWACVGTMYELIYKVGKEGLLDA